MTEDDLREPIEELAEEFMERQRRGERPSISEYLDKYPALADEIRELFPTIAAMESIKTGQDRSPTGRVSLGAARIEKLGEFSIIREIGRGGMGIVYEAEQESLKRRVALKVLPRASLMNEDGLKRFQKEAIIAANLQHPGIVPVYSLGQADGFHFIVMQYIQGLGWDRLIQILNRLSRDMRTNLSAEALVPNRLLESLVREEFLGDGAMPREPLPGQSPTSSSSENRPAFLGSAYFKEAVGLVLQAAEALDQAHHQGVWHRDIKPANLLLDMDGRAWVTDFGLAKAFQDEELTSGSQVMGTIRFMAPEQFDGRADSRCDIYSLGLTMYELLTLKPAFSESSQSELIKKILHEGPPPARRANPALPEALESIIMKAGARIPNHRYQTAGSLALDLKKYLDGRAPRARFNRSAPPLPSEAKRPNPLKGRVLVALLLAALLIVGLFAARPLILSPPGPARPDLDRPTPRPPAAVPPPAAETGVIPPVPLETPPPPRPDPGATLQTQDRPLPPPPGVRPLLPPPPPGALPPAPRTTRPAPPAGSTEIPGQNPVE